MEIKDKIKRFATQVIRSPINPLKKLNALPTTLEALDSFVQELFADSIFKESIFIASLVLYQEWQAAYQTGATPAKREKLNRSILKYYIRSFSKCVPFGLFANYGVINGKDHKFALLPGQQKKLISLDSTFLTHIYAAINSAPSLADVISYTPNNTIYKSGHHLRFIESNIRGNSKNFSLSSIDDDEVIGLIRQECKAGMRKPEIVLFLMDSIEGISEAETLDFVNALIASQVLVSTLDFKFNGGGDIHQILSFLTENANIVNQDPMLKNYAQAIGLIESILHEVNAGACESLPGLQKILDILARLNIPLAEKNLFGVNLKKGYGKVAEEIINKDEALLKQAIHLLSIFSSRSPDSKNSSLSKLATFRKAFMERYEDNEVPLMQVLDNELGIGYMQGNKDSALFSELLDELRLPAATITIEKIQAETVLDDFWFRVLLQAQANHDTTIDLQKQDLSLIAAKSAPLRGTFSMVYNKIGDKISMVMSGGSSALNLISRFSCEDLELQALVNEIAQAEDEIFSEQLVAEIIHTPHVRAGNIMARKIVRNFEIPILAIGSAEATPIALDDLTVSVRNGKVSLKSRSLQKEVIPYLSSAQNFHYDSLPIFHFLCDIQAQYRSNYLSISFNSLIHKYFSFIPRITFGEGLILSSATWKFTRVQLSHLIKQNGLLDFDKLNLFFQQNQVPKYIVLVEAGEESLIINTENKLALSLLNDSLKKHNKLHFKECLYDIDENPNQYCNEYVASFISETRVRSLPNRIATGAYAMKYIPGNEWLYFKVYTGMRSADALLSATIGPLAAQLLEKGTIDKWFFIRYADPDFHIRVRFHFSRQEDKLEILDFFNQAMENYIDREVVWKIELGTYARELERYGGDNISACEEIFFHDSKMVCDLISVLKAQDNEHLLWKYCLLSIDRLLTVFNFSLQQKSDFAISCYDFFADEFHVDRNLRKQLGAKFREHLPDIEKLQARSHDKCLDIIEARDNKIKDIIVQMSTKNSSNSRLISSMVHMTINRTVNSNARLHELVIYSLLEKYYKKKIANHKTLLLQDLTL